MSTADQHKDAYREEAMELLAELETSLLDLEQSPDDMELIGRIFRALHTIKGSGSMFGFEDIAEFTHEVETVFDIVRNGQMSVTKELIDLTLSAGDHVRMMLNVAGTGKPADTQKAGEIIASLQRLSPDKKGPDAARAASSEEDDSASLHEGKTITCRIRFRPPGDIFMRGINPLLILDDLRALGECRIIAQKEGIPALNEIDPEYCYTYWDAVLTTDQGINAVKEVFEFIEDGSDLKIDIIDIIDDTPADSHKKLGDILVERGDVTPDDLRKVLGRQKRIGELLVDADLVDTGKVESALTEQRHVREVQEKYQRNETVSSIRVSSDKLDRLVNLVGELVTVQARLTRTSALRNDPELLSISEEVERLTEYLRDNTMSVRMVPIGTMFNKFKRLVRDLSAETGKEVEMSTEGADTELDKTVIDKLNDPLVHMIRNSIDHGIEPPEARQAMGKPRAGMLHLSARHSGANVLIEITDDGAGLDPEAIRARAAEKGLIEPDAELSEKETFALIFEPGFSTARKITSLSGRGVGMDVVKRSIEALRGSIEISSQKNTGTTMTLKIPLTLAIIDGLLVKIAEEVFVIPLSIIEECVELSRDAAGNGRRISNVRGEIVPYISLREHFMINGDKPLIEQIVITRIEGRRVGLVVDHVIGEHQTVIKTLGRIYRDVEGVSGATILGDGRVALILDVPRLVQNVEKEVAFAG